MKNPKKYTRQEAWRKRNPLTVWSWRATKSAIRAGLIEKQPCAVCGAEDSEAHHPDYHRPLMIEWLCRSHHRAVHRRKGGEG